jgi:hypothetical protein
MAKVGLDKSSLVSGSQERLKVEINSNIKAKNKIKIPEPRIFSRSSMIMYTKSMEKARKESASCTVDKGIVFNAACLNPISIPCGINKNPRNKVVLFVQLFFFPVKIT